MLVKVDPSLDLDDLRRQFHFEIVSEQEDGFVIAASEDVDLAILRQKLTDFVGSDILQMTDLVRFLERRCLKRPPR